VSPSCGDGECQAYANENCGNCPEDCGYCELKIESLAEKEYSADDVISVKVKVVGIEGGTEQPNIYGAVTVSGELIKDGVTVQYNKYGYTDNSGIAVINFDPTYTGGIYQVKLTAYHPRTSETYTITDTITLKPRLFVELKGNQEGAITPAQQYVNKPVVIDIYTKDRNGAPVDGATFDIEAWIYKGGIEKKKVTLSSPTYVTYGVNEIVWNTPEVGDLVVNVTARRFGYSDSKPVTYAVEIEKPFFKVDTGGTLTHGMAVDKTGDYEVLINIYNPQNEPIRVEKCELNVIDPNGFSKTYTLNSVSEGQYFGTIKFDKIGYWRIYLNIEKYNFECPDTVCREYGVNVLSTAPLPWSFIVFVIATIAILLFIFRKKIFSR